MNETGSALQKATQRTTRTLGLGLLAFGVLGSSPVKAERQYTPVLEFNEMTHDEQVLVLETALATMYDFYSVHEPNKAIADCIIDLFNNPDREITGYEHLGIALQVALRNENPSDYSVESILLGIVNAQCPSASNE